MKLVYLDETILTFLLLFLRCHVCYVTMLYSHPWRKSQTHSHAHTHTHINWYIISIGSFKTVCRFLHKKYLFFISWTKTSKFHTNKTRNFQLHRNKYQINTTQQQQTCIFWKGSSGSDERRWERGMGEKVKTEEMVKPLLIFFPLWSAKHTFPWTIVYESSKFCEITSQNKRWFKK